VTIRAQIGVRWRQLRTPYPPVGGSPLRIDDSVPLMCQLCYVTIV
jgi:hypothetical protein